MKLHVVSALVLGTLSLQILPPLPAFAAQVSGVIRTFDTPVDAFSVRLHNASHAQYQYQTVDAWSVWMPLSTDPDGNPQDTESELVMLPYGATAVRVQGVTGPADIHPISVSHEPVRTLQASLVAVNTPSVVSRRDWAADDNYLFTVPSTTDSTKETDSTKGDNGGGSQQVSQREQDCMQAQTNYPDEFRVASTVKKDAQGRTYLWPLQYSKNIKLLTVHHTALGVKNDPRPAAERVRALYKYHAVTKGWGDIGYHYVVDENGTVYEGRTGGKAVIGGHAYCNNTGTIGIVLLGNFENEQPTQKQAKGLQVLLADLADQYDINLQKSVQYHGKTFASPVVRHRDLLSTLCPGYFLAEAFGQIVQHVRSGDLTASINFPLMAGGSSSSTASSHIITSPLGLEEGIAFTGRTTISSNPGGKQRLSFTYTAGRDGAYEGKKVADIRLPSQIKLFVDDGFQWVPVTKGILLPSDLPAYETVSLQLVVEAPIDAGNYSFDVAGIRFTLAVAGRRARTGVYQSPYYANPLTIVRQSTPASSASPVTARVRPQSRRTIQSKSSSPASRTVPTLPSLSSTDSSPEIRLKLSASQNPVLRFAQSGTADGMSVAVGSELSLMVKAGVCEAQSRGVRFASGPILRFLSSQPIVVEGVAGKTRSYRGVLECRVIGGSLVLINELSMESYLRGLAEEPDTEPYEKQRAFAIAARTYAIYYLSSDHRKFVGMPYDGSDSPAEFQSYAGVGSEAANPRWVQAVENTENKVLTYQGELFKPAYFSSDDGRTRSPEEIGWKNFPAAAVFASKPDPWCVGMTMRGHGVGMSGCGALGQAKEGKSAEEILQYYYQAASVSELK